MAAGAGCWSAFAGSCWGVWAMTAAPPIASASATDVHARIRFMSHLRPHFQGLAPAGCNSHAVSWDELATSWRSAENAVASALRRSDVMPEKATIKRARRDKRQGKAASTQAGEFVREEMHHVREGKHGARPTKQAIAIGLSKARRAGVKLPPPKRGAASSE